MTDKGVTTASYTGSVFSVFSALTLTEWGIITGIVTALCTFALKTWWDYRRDRREQEAHQAALAMIRSGRQRGRADLRMLAAVATLSIAAGSSGFYFAKGQEGTGPTKTVGQQQVAVAYPDAAHGWKVPTICAGRTKGVFQGQTATMGECDAWLIEDLTYAGDAIKRCSPVKMTQWQYNYLVSFVHNVGGGAYCGSQVARNINAGRCEAAAKEMHAVPQIDRATGKPRIWRGKTIIYRQTGEVLLATGAPVMKWTTAAGIPLPGLIKRRNTEAAGFAADCDLWGRA